MHIRLEEVDFRYGTEGFRLNIPRWELASRRSAAFIGPSGSGKSTLLRLLAGILVPRDGTVEMNGQNLPVYSDASRRAFRIRNVGFVFQDFRLVEYLDVRENLLLPFRINRALELGENADVEAMAERLDIAEHLKKYPAELSQGEKQRVAIGRALLPGPGLVLADEPTGNLDPNNTRRIMDLLLEQTTDATLVMATHDHTLARRLDEVMDFSKFQSS